MSEWLDTLIGVIVVVVIVLIIVLIVNRVKKSRDKEAVEIAETCMTTTRGPQGILPDKSFTVIDKSTQIRIVHNVYFDDYGQNIINFILVNPGNLQPRPAVRSIRYQDLLDVRLIVDGNVITTARSLIERGAGPDGMFAARNALDAVQDKKSIHDISVDFPDVTSQGAVPLTFRVMQEAHKKNDEYIQKAVTVFASAYSILSRNIAGAGMPGPFPGGRF